MRLRPTYLNTSIEIYNMELNLGCGRDIRKGYVNLDMAKLKEK